MTTAALPTPRPAWPSLWLLGLAALVGVGVAVAPAAVMALVILPVGIVLATRPYYSLVLLVCFVPLEEFLLKWLPVSDQLYSLSRFGSEMLIYVTGMVVLGYKVLTGRALRRTRLDLPVACFVLAVLLSLVINRSPIVGSVANVRPFLRYVFLYYVVVNLPLSPRQIRSLLSLILAGGALQVMIGFLQLTGGPGVQAIFLPRATDLSVGDFEKSYRVLSAGREIGSLSGTLGDTVGFGFFLVVVLSVLVARYRRLRFPLMLFTLALLANIGWSYSRAATLAGLICLGLWFRLRHGWGATILVGLGTMIPAVALLVFVSSGSSSLSALKSQQSVLVNLGSVFSRQYLDAAQKQRLAALVGNVPTILVNKPVLGYGPDRDKAIDALNHSQRSFLLKVWSKEGFKDVYWAAVLTFYGLAGLSAMIWMFVRLYRLAWRVRRRSPNGYERQIADAMIILVLVTAFLLFFNQTIEFRAFGFYFWLVAGLLVASQHVPRAAIPRPG